MCSFIGHIKSLDIISIIIYIISMKDETEIKAGETSARDEFSSAELRALDMAMRKRKEIHAGKNARRMAENPRAVFAEEKMSDEKMDADASAYTCIRICINACIEAYIKYKEACAKALIDFDKTCTKARTVLDAALAKQARDLKKEKNE